MRKGQEVPRKELETRSPAHAFPDGNFPCAAWEKKVPLPLWPLFVSLMGDG